ncbi:MAG: UDP-N-acetylglucosamine 2-epimerase (non-hydrolyzing) [bacterium]|nr:UDP-N-acetylglucosamine 2-epimerase (non-hydrolyzing) [Candidatus Omnitrophota bacterium]
MSKANKKKKVVVVFGTRPEAIKLVPVVKQLQRNSSVFETVVCTTAQHREMLDEVLDLFDIKLQYDLNLMRRNQGPLDFTIKGLAGIKKILERENPDFILVQGDTATTFVASLAAFHQRIPIGHIEAGLRTNDKYNPFPEEINRRLTSHLADFHFAPTVRAKDNLISENISKASIFLTGNTIIDALFYVLKGIKKNNNCCDKFPYLKDKSKKVILVTAHRRENFGQPLQNIVSALKKIVERNKDVIVVYPVHPNPNVKKNVDKLLADIERIHLIVPLNYADFVYLMNQAYLILTDSGGVQEEASSLGKPILIMRDKTERVEAVEAGAAELVGTNVNKIIKFVEILLNDAKVYSRMAKAVNPFGDGAAAEKIIKILKERI